ncbi:hypothetical protein FQN54_001203 [Arachnomyces sp. PD_36]|nr:hypothetical protein FQN54_001203 [Arachnomyces sp. PD_36]
MAKNGRKQKKNAEPKKETPTKAKASRPSTKPKNKKAHSKPEATCYESSGPELYPFDYPAQQQYGNNGWGYPQQPTGPWGYYAGYYTNDQFVSPGYSQPFGGWGNGYGTTDATIDFMEDNGEDFWDDAPTYGEQVQTIDDVIASLVIKKTMPTEGFQLRGDAPEFIPEKKFETNVA